MNRVRMLMHFGVTPYIVFDGANLPSKAGTDSDRNARRAESRTLGLELLRLGKTSQAHQELQKAVDVTPEMAGLLIQELKRVGVKYVVAPYEADAQLAYLERTGVINGIISEDSDLLVFGARCLLTKLDQFGECVMIRRDDFTACREVSLVGWSDQDFRRMAILSGCDYLDNIGKMGLKTAYRLLRKHKTVERVLQAVRLEGKMKVPPNYLEKFIQAEMTFLYQWVFCPTANGLVNTTAPTASVKVSEMTFIGEFVQSVMAAGVARGELHPHTKEPLKLPATRDTHSKQRYHNKTHDVENLKSKKTVSLAEFFKPKRVPLAELEPNSFILTPRQQELARHASTASWSSPIVRAPDRTDTENTPIIAQAARRSSLGTLATPTSALPRAKRQRLCQDEPPDRERQSTASVIDEKSKFFSRPEKRKRRHVSSEFNIHSDDSVEEALRNLPDQNLTPIKHCVPNENVKAKENLQTKGESGATEADDSEITLVEIIQSSDETYIFNDAEETFVEDSGYAQQPFDQCLLQDIQSIDKQSASKSSQLRKNGSKCLNKENNSLTTHLAACLIPELPTQTSYEDRGSIPKPALAAAGTKTVIPTGNALEPSSPGLAGNLDSIIVQGSEDFLVSESDIEDAEHEGSVKVLNLQRFAFNSA
jgi:exonuclease 1